MSNKPRRTLHTTPHPAFAWCKCGRCGREYVIESRVTAFELARAVCSCGHIGAAVIKHGSVSRRGPVHDRSAAADFARDQVGGINPATGKPEGWIE